MAKLGLQPPQKAPAFHVRPDMLPEEALRGMVLATYQQMHGNADGVVASDNPEYVHQMRIAVRRLRSVLRMFRQTSADDLQLRRGAALKALGRTLGAVRDLDVFQEAVEPTLLAMSTPQAWAARAAIEKRVGAARARLRRHLQTAAYRRLIAQLARWLAAPVPATGDTGLMRLARRQLGHLNQRIERGAARLETQDDAGRHALRIQIKRARYAAELFAGLYAAKDACAYVAALSRLQDSLGSLTDINTAKALLRDLGISEDVEARLLAQLAKRAARAARPLGRGFAAAAAAAGFWKRPHWRNGNVRVG